MASSESLNLNFVALLQASDFYTLPLSDDQGAISRFLTSATGAFQPAI